MSEVAVARDDAVGTDDGRGGVVGAPAIDGREGCVQSVIHGG